MVEAKKAEAKKPAKVVITPELRRIWFKVRDSWNRSLEAFSSIVSLLTPKEAEQLYDIVKLSLFKDSYAQMLQEHPGLKEIVKTDDDRLCMHDIYENISWRLGKSEKLPKDIATKLGMKGRIGRGLPGTSTYD